MDEEQRASVERIAGSMSQQSREHLRQLVLRAEGLVLPGQEARATPVPAEVGGGADGPEVTAAVTEERC